MEKALPHPFPSPPRRPPVVGFHIHTADNKYAFFNFGAHYAARAFLDLFRPFRWLTENEVITDNGTRIKAEDARSFNQVLDATLTKQEEAWQVPEPYLTLYRRYAGITQDDQEIPRVTPPGSTPAVTPRKRPQRAPRAPQSPSEHVTIADIAAQLGISPSNARSALRKAGTPKPPGGWSFPPADVEAIKTTIKKNLR